MDRLTPPISPLPYPELWVLERYVAFQSGFVLRSMLDLEEDRKTGFSPGWNCPANGLTPRQLAETYWTLWQREEIDIYADGRNEPAVLSTSGPDEIEAWMQAANDGRYYGARITQKGVERWELHAMPN